jgi:O-antigen/teichoic acid export membrane protein
MSLAALQGPADAPPDGKAEAGKPAAAAREFVRGSSLLFLGRIISVFLNMAVQVLTVRYLSQGDYGAFAYALGVASMGSSFLLLGLGKAVPRFVPLYQERGAPGRAFGTIVLAVGTVVGLGVAVVLALHGLRGVVSGSIVTDPLSLSVLLILIVMAPLNALDNLLQNVVAVFIGASAIFYRRHLVGPGLKLAAVLLVMLVAGDVHLLAYGYVIGGILGVWLYASILIREWRSKDLLRYLNPKRFSLPAREVFGFSVPLLTSEFSVLIRGSVAVLLLEYFRTTTAVAEYRAVLPVAGLNLMVFEAFTFLFVPLASRMYARSDRKSISDLYWQTSIWISVLTFPMLAVSCALAAPVTVLLFGAEYADSAPILALLALGFYVTAAMGFNAQALRVHGRIKFLLMADVAAGILGVTLAILLIPPLGAFGAAIAVTALLVSHALMNQFGLWLTGTGIHVIDRRFVRIHGMTLGLLGGLIAFQQLLDPPLYQGLGVAALMSLVLIRLTRRTANIADTFPELLRVPLLGWLLR